MFAWYVKGIPATYSPSIKQGVSAVSPTPATHAISSDSATSTSTLAESQSSTSIAVKGYGEPHLGLPQERRKIVLLREIMSSPVKTVLPDTLMEDVSKLFASKKLRHVPVCTPKGELCGIASERDLLRKMVALASEKRREAPPPPPAATQALFSSDDEDDGANGNSLRFDMPSPPVSAPSVTVPLTPVMVKDFMKSKVLTAAPTAEIRFAARVMFEEKIGALPIIEDNGALIGIVTRSDILKALVNLPPLEMWT